ncbi:cyclodeaminase/cyclohydrolase family protein [Iodobacter fluviatilis]|uniref:Formiminotetrahydrofolate cyclodeaminase n=1 Tax=Iodobacter fluviatilis TaxID=537 RepID=A0A377Q302_9NEIS|nr:cyclodeaminase/cyclohydrolase family protein [Iodobacter fluviatilis]TCU90629.1 formiminotetrahydrofolate cyclodeaminase [Iodobacter fluviatilis]STQ89656.1 Glutamate formiminotransferase [Iodobacter fluviatilis]
MSAYLLPDSLAELFKTAASTDAVPGGGCVACVSANLGVALLLKAIRITLKSKPGLAILQEAEERLLGYAGQCLDYAQQDAEVFFQFLAAYKLPESTGAEQTLRLKSIEQAAVSATQLGIVISAMGNDILQLCCEIKPDIKLSIVADIVAGAHLVFSMIAVAIENANANLSDIQSVYPDLKASVLKAQTQSQALLAALV